MSWQLLETGPGHRRGVEGPAEQAGVEVDDIVLAVLDAPRGDVHGKF